MYFRDGFSCKNGKRAKILPNCTLSFPPARRRPEDLGGPATIDVLGADRRAFVGHPAKRSSVVSWKKLE